MKNIIKNEFHNKYLFIYIGIIIIFYIVIFHFLFYTNKANILIDYDFLESNNRQTLYQFNFSEVNSIIWFPLNSLLVINSLISTNKFISINRIDKNKFKNLNFKILLIWYLNNLLLNIILISMSVTIIFTICSFNFILGGYLDFLIVFLFILLISIFSYIPISLFIYIFYLLFKFKVFIGMVLTFNIIVSSSISIASNAILSNSIRNDSTEYTYNIETDVNSIKISNNDLMILNQYLKFYDYKINFSEIILKEKENILNNFCYTHDTKIHIKNENIYYICNVEQKLIDQAFLNNKGINLIWKNSINNEDAIAKFKDIIDWIKKDNNIDLALKMFKEKLDHLFESEYEDKIRIIYNLIKYDPEKGLTFGSGIFPQEYYDSLTQLIKMIFYYYLLNYLSNPTELDIITNKEYGDVFLTFLETNYFEVSNFYELFNSFLWNNSNESNIYSKIFNNSNFEIKNINLFFNNYITPQIFIDILNQNGINVEQINLISKFNKRVRNNNIFNIFSLYDNLLNKLVPKNEEMLNYIKSPKEINVNNFMSKNNLQNIKYFSNKYIIKENTKFDLTIIFMLVIYITLTVILLVILYFLRKVTLIQRFHSRSFPIII